LVQLKNYLIGRSTLVGVMKLSSLLVLAFMIQITPTMLAISTTFTIHPAPLRQLMLPTHIMIS
jgi:hypothetical protein